MRVRGATVGSSRSCQDCLFGRRQHRWGTNRNALLHRNAFVHNAADDQDAVMGVSAGGSLGLCSAREQSAAGMDARTARMAGV